MNRFKLTIVCGLFLGMGLAGCSGDGGASVPRGAGADAAPNNAELNPAATGKGKNVKAPAGALD